jgi:hypothetical protein
MSIATPPALSRYRLGEVQLRRMGELGYVPVPTNGHPAAVELSVEQYERLMRLGVLGEDDRCELIDGEVLAKMPIGADPTSTVKRINRLLSARVGEQAVVGVQDPIRLSPRSEPQPDVSVAPLRDDFYRSGHPSPDDLYLVIEVADTSLEDDRDVKGPIYPKAGIGEFWIVDVTEPGVHVFRDPRPDGTWGTALRPGPGESLAAPSVPGVTVAVAELLG